MKLYRKKWTVSIFSVYQENHLIIDRLNDRKLTIQFFCLQRQEIELGENLLVLNLLINQTEKYIFSNSAVIFENHFRLP
jgi:hypothetical protein